MYVACPLSLALLSYRYSRFQFLSEMMSRVSSLYGMKRHRLKTKLSTYDELTSSLQLLAVPGSLYHLMLDFVFDLSACAPKYARSTFVRSEFGRDNVQHRAGGQ